MDLKKKENMQKDLPSSSHKNAITKYIQCQYCQRYYEVGKSIEDHFKKNSLCHQNHDKVSETIFIKCEGSSCKKKFFKFGMPILSHIREHPYSM